MYDTVNHDRLFKIRQLLDYLLPKYQQLPQQQVVSIDKVPFCYKIYFIKKTKLRLY